MCWVRFGVYNTINEWKLPKITLFKKYIDFQAANAASCQRDHDFQCRNLFPITLASFCTNCRHFLDKHMLFYAHFNEKPRKGVPIFTNLCWGGGTNLPLAYSNRVFRVRSKIVILKQNRPHSKCILFTARFNRKSCCGFLLLAQKFIIETPLERREFALSKNIFFCFARNGSKNPQNISRLKRSLNKMHFECGRFFLKMSIFYFYISSKKHNFSFVQVWKFLWVLAQTLWSKRP